MKNRTLKIIILILLGVLFYDGYEFIKLQMQKSNIEEVVISGKNELKNNNSIAIMIQDPNTNTYSEMKNRDSWPPYPEYIFMKAECDDGYGAKIVGTDVMDYDESANKISMTTKTTLYCTLYFTSGANAATVLAQKGGSTFKKVFEEDTMHRFYGTYEEVKNNYVCFGTTNVGDCITNKDTYLYRIIGITDIDDSILGLVSGQLKLIKASPSKTDQIWSTSYYGTSAKLWNESELATYLNNDFLNTLDINWQKLISNNKWYIGSLRAANTWDFQTNVETTDKVSNTYKIGLMYATDYYNSNKYYSTKTWLYLLHGAEGNQDLQERTMSYYGTELLEKINYSWNIHTSGYLMKQVLNVGYAVRPVFYLNSNVKLSGEGIEESPFIITT